MPRPRVLLFGSSNTDFSVTCPRLPKPGETLTGGEFRRSRGGKGANQAVAAARAGARVIFVGARGQDAMGREAVAGLRAEGIDVSHFRIAPDLPSGIALILLGGRSRENMIAVARSANDSVSEEDIQAVEKEFSKAKIAVAKLEIPLPAVLAVARAARQANCPFLLNPAPAQRLPASLLQLVQILTPNEHEATQLTGESDPKRAGAALVRKGCRQVVITLGAGGALLVTRSGRKHFRAPKVRAVDTVGAGDCFTGWLATAVAEGLPIEEAIPLALQAASLAVTRPGAQAAMPHRHEVS